MTLLVCRWSHAQGQTAPAPTPSASSAENSTLLQEPAAFDVRPGETKSFTIALPSGTARRLSVEQLLGAVELRRITGPATTPRRNPAGLHAVLDVHLLAGSAGTEQLSLRNLSPGKLARVLITPGSAHDITPQDQQQAAAEEAFAHAETIRLERKTSSYSDALASYGSAIATWRTMNDQADASRALAWKALFFFVNQSDAKAALPLVNEAALHVDQLSPVEAANCFKIAGYVHVQLGEYPAGRAAYTAALQRFRATGDRFNEEVLLDNLSRLERLQGDTDAALQDATQADALAGELGDVTRQLKIKAEIGAIQLSASHLEAAYTAYQAALALLPQAPDAMTEGYIWSDLGVLYTLLHEYDRAEAALAAATAVWARAPNPAGEINTLDDQGELWMNQQRLPRAQAAYTRGLALAERQSLPRDRVFLLRGLGATYLMQNDLAHAQPNLQAALDLALKIGEGDGLPEIYCLLGDLHARQQDHTAAEQSYRQCQTSATDRRDTYSSIRAYGSLARLQLTDGNLNAASASIEQALAGIEADRKLLSDQDLRTSFFSSMRSYYDLAITILDRMARLDPRGGYEWQAFLTAERARSRALLDITSAPSGKAPALLSELQAVEEQLRHEQSRPQTAALRVSILRLQVRRDSLISAAQSSVAETQPGTPLTLASIQAAMPPAHSVLLEYWIGDAASYLWAITPNGVRFFRLAAPAVLQRNAAAFRESLLSAANRDPALTAEQRAAALDAADIRTTTQSHVLRSLLFPAGALPSDTTTLLLVADGPLLSLPFAALRAPAPRSTSAGLPSHCDILAEPSATFLQQLIARPPSPLRTARIAIFTAAAAPEHASAGGQAGRGSLAPLPFALSEVQSIQTTFGPANTHLITAGASDSNDILHFDWSGYTVGHFATHAVLNRHAMDLTSIVLAPADHASTANARLWYTDICRMHAPLELAVLSACDTAAGADVPGEGLVGLSQAFFAAGAKRVVGTLWPINDQATSLLMRRFYTALRSTGSPAAALRTAQQSLAASPDWGAPYYWAAFSLAGDWRTLPVDPPSAP